MAHSLCTPGIVDIARRDFNNPPRAEQDLACTEIQLQGNDAWINLAVQVAGVGIWSWDTTHDRIELTEFARILHGLPFDTVVSYRTWLMNLHADDLESAHQAIQRALDKKSDYRNEYRVSHPDGSVRWILAQGRADYDDAGNPLRLAGVLSDVTARKNAEQVLKDQLQALAHMARVSTLGELSAALAHELNQPLTAILCNAQAGKRILTQSPPDQEELSAILSDIAEDDRRAGTVVSRLRALFKREDGVQQLLNINAVVEEVAQLLRSEFITKQVFLNLQLGVNLPGIKGDPVQVRQVLLNLMMNGIEAMAATASGPHRLRICTSMRDADSLEVIVLDTGPGINPQMLEQIFEPFVTGKSQGLGMGLAISRTIVNAHGGRLWAENDSGGGAALRFTLPVFQGCNP